MPAIEPSTHCGETRTLTTEQDAQLRTSQTNSTVALGSSSSFVPLIAQWHTPIRYTYCHVTPVKRLCQQVRWCSVWLTISDTTKWNFKHSAEPLNSPYIVIITLMYFVLFIEDFRKAKTQIKKLTDFSLLFGFQPNLLSEMLWRPLRFCRRLQTEGNISECFLPY